MTHGLGDWDAIYQESTPPPWDIGRPQPEFARLADEGRLRGRLLDAGCGTGEHTLLASQRGATAHGVDISATAIALARNKSEQRRLPATFEVGNILELDLPEGGFDTVIDSGVFHVFDDIDRGRYVTAIGTALRHDGRCLLMCFSDAQPGDWGPRRVHRDELELAFADGWEIERIVPAEFAINPTMGSTTASAWLAELRRVPIR